MSISINSQTALEQAQANLVAAKEAKTNAEQTKNDATVKEAAAVEVAAKKLAEAEAASAEAEQKAAALAPAQEKVNATSLRVSTAQQAYSNALNQLAQATAGGNESAISCAQSAVDRAYSELEAAQNEAKQAQEELETKTREAEEAKQQAEVKNAESLKAQEEADQAKTELEQANTALATTVTDLETAEAAVADAEAVIAEEEAAEALTTGGVQEAEHLSQAEVDKLVQQGYTYITSKEQFLSIFQGGNTNLQGKYLLGCDIDLNDVENWTPVGSDNKPFQGIFDGNGYSIDNLTIRADNNAENVGFFGVTENATVQNITFNNASVVTPEDFINGSSAVGIVAGTARGTKFDNIDISGSVSGFQSIGGLAGVINDNSFMRNGVRVDIGNSSISNINTNVDANGKYYVGGLVGYIKDTSTSEGVATRDMKITNCNTSGNITFEEESAGGLIGEAGKTIITINNCDSSVNLTWNNTEYDGDLSFLMETGRAGGFIGCINGSYIAICNSGYNGNLNVDGDFKGEWYGWYMNDAHTTIYELSQGLPIDDILNIDGIDALTPVVNSQTGISRYEVTVSTLTGLDKMVTMIQANPSLADIVTFNVNFDFEAMDGMYDPSVYSQYGVVQHLYEDSEGKVHNDVYIDNEIDLETTFHRGESPCAPCQPCENGECIILKPTMVSGLYKDSNDNYVVNTNAGLKTVDMKFNYEDQITDITKRLETDEVRFREYITIMVWHYQTQMHNILRSMFGLSEEAELPIINKAEYKKLQKMQEAGMKLSQEQKLAMAVYEVDYTVMNKVSETTHNYGCGMGGNASFLDASKAIQMYDDAGRPLFTTLNGDSLRQRMGEDGTLMFDEEGSPVYEYLDGSDYEGLAEVFAQRGYPKTDEDGNFLYTDKDGNSITKITDEDGNTVYKNADGSIYEGAEEDLSQQLDPYSNSQEYGNLQNEMQSILNDVEAGKYPLDPNAPKDVATKSTPELQTESAAPEVSEQDATQAGVPEAEVTTDETGETVVTIEIPEDKLEDEEVL